MIHGRDLARRAAVFLGYLAVACLYNPEVVLHFRSMNFGRDGDPALFMWSLNWWPYAIAHHLNPFLADKIYNGTPVNLAWSTTVPFFALTLWPITRAFGVIASYNAAVLLSFAFSAFAAYLLAHYVTKNHAASLFAGFVYGFSPYMISQSLYHLHMLGAFVPPLLALLVIDSLAEKKLPWGAAGISFGILLVVQGLVSTEILFTSAIFLAIGLIVCVFLKAGNRGGIKVALTSPGAARLAKMLALGFSIFLVLFSPYLYYALFGPYRPAETIHSTLFCDDLLNFIFPGGAMLAGGKLFDFLNRYFPGGIQEANAYVPFPLWIAVLVGIKKWRRHPAVKACLLLFFSAAVLSLGARLSIGGAYTPVPLPWNLIRSLSVAKNVLPNRLMLFGYLSLSVLSAIYFKKIFGSRRGKLAERAVLLSAVLLMLPRIPFAGNTFKVPGIFASPENAARHIRSGSNVFVAPSRDEEVTLLFQVRSGMSFRMMTAGDLQLASQGYQSVYGSPIMWVLYDLLRSEESLLPLKFSTLRSVYARALADRKVDYIVVTDDTPNAGRMISYLSWVTRSPPVHADGAYIWRVNPGLK